MKRIALGLLSSLLLHPSSFGQGALTPPGPPASTMKTLEQIEPRTPISALPFTISQPGSDYLTTNLTGSVGVTNGITIAASGVTLNLMGFELVGGTGAGIVVSGLRTNIAIRNGTVRNWSDVGVDTRFLSFNSHLERLRVSSNGDHGIFAGPGSTVSGCSATGNNSDGIRVTGDCNVLNNTVTFNGNNVAGSTAGIHATGKGNRIDGNHAFNNNGDGILVETNAVRNFVVRNTAGGQTCIGCFQLRVPGAPGQPPAGANVVGPIVNDATNVNASAWANLYQF